MGDYISTLHENEHQESISSPEKSDWIVSHVKATGRALLEVERLWLRFQQLGCNEAGVLDNKILRSPLARNDKLVKNILKAMLGSGRQLTFLDFLKIVDWAETAPPENKLRLMFYLLQNGDPVSAQLMFKVLKVLYPADTDEAIWKITEEFMRVVSKRDEDFVSEEQFMEAAESLPKETLKSLLNFRIIPIDVLNEAYKIFNMPEYDKAKNPNNGIPSTELLENISGNIGGADISTLAARLGFSPAELEKIQRDYPYDRSLQVEALLLSWRDRNESQALSGELKKALIAANMNDAAKLINN